MDQSIFSSGANKRMSHATPQLREGWDNIIWKLN